MRMIALIVTAMLSATMPGRAADATIDETACWFDPPQGLAAQCYEVVVPAFRAEESAERFTLPVAVIVKPGVDYTAVPVVFVQGGPGAATFREAYPESDMTGWWLETAASLIEGRAVVLFDARGTGASVPSLDCPEANAQAREADEPPGSDQPFFSRQSAAIAACRQRLDEAGVTVEAVSTHAMADDIADIAAVLGYGQVDLWAFSFGTRVALETIRRHPGLVHAAVLDSTMGTGGHADEDLPFMTWRSFDRLFTDCEAQDACNRAFPELRQRFLSRLEQMNEEPERLIVVDVDRWGRGKSILMSGDDLVFYIYDAFYVSEALPYIPSLLEAGLDGDSTGFTMFYWYPYLADWALAEGAFLTVWCREFVPFTDHEVVSREVLKYGVLGRAGAAIQTEPACDDWPVTPLAQDDPRPVEDDLPILFINGAYDPATPPEWAAEIATHFPNSRHMIYPWAGHTPSGSDGCAREEAIAFLREASGQTARRDPLCSQDQAPPAFVIGR